MTCALTTPLRKTEPDELAALKRCMADMFGMQLQMRDTLMKALLALNEMELALQIMRAERDIEGDCETEGAAKVFTTTVH